ncbi:MAG: hypothetical protein PHE79_01900 [Eubacteriales bacterium]|nr:hypothetical protein [Eubacteriales bacterium]
MARQEFKWTQHNIDKLKLVKEILEELEQYKPLTLRQVYYQLVGKGHIENNKSQYVMLSKLLKWARIDDHIPWSDIEDRVRDYHSSGGWNDVDNFIRSEINGLFKYYSRNLAQTQPKYIEVWIEKDALSSIFTNVAEKYYVPVTVCRGFSSVSFLNDFKNRLDRYAKEKPAVMLYFGDFDPSGVEMMESMRITLKEELGISDIEFKRVGLLKDDIERYKLPHNPDALKKKDTRAEKHVKKYGELAVELDALRPNILEQKIQEAIEAEFDMEAFEQEKRIYWSEIDKLTAYRERFQNLLEAI